MLDLLFFDSDGSENIFSKKGKLESIRKININNVQRKSPKIHVTNQFEGGHNVSFSLIRLSNV